jgi:hypothetical protein
MSSAVNFSACSRLLFREFPAHCQNGYAYTIGTCEGACITHTQTHTYIHTHTQLNVHMPARAMTSTQSSAFLWSHNMHAHIRMVKYTPTQKQART